MLERKVEENEGEPMEHPRRGPKVRRWSAAMRKMHLTAAPLLMKRKLILKWTDYPQALLLNLEELWLALLQKHPKAGCFLVTGIGMLYLTSQMGERSTQMSFLLFFNLPS